MPPIRPTTMCKRWRTRMLVLAGLTDPRVTYWEPAKWVARLRENSTPAQQLIALNTNMDAGHGGAAGRFERFKEVALDYAFALKISRRPGVTSHAKKARDLVASSDDNGSRVESQAETTT